MASLIDSVAEDIKADTFSFYFSVIPPLIMPVKLGNLLNNRPGKNAGIIIAADLLRFNPQKLGVLV
jgi:hypothetical protein